MPQFGSPISLGYGLGAIGAGIGQGLVRGAQEAPQLGYERLRNQALQTQLTNQQAQQQALSTEAPTPEGQQDLTPYDKPLRDMEAQMQALRASGQGQKIAEMTPQYVDLSQKQHVAQLGRGAQMLLGPNPKAALPFIKGAGLGDVQDVNVDPQTGNFTFVAPDGSQTQLSRQDVANIAADPQHLAQYMAMQNLYGARIQNYQNLGQSRQAETQRKTQADIWRHMDTTQRIAQSGTNAEIAAGGRTGAAQITANAAMQRFKNAPQQQAFEYFTDAQNGLGLSPDQAYAALSQAKAMTKTVSPEQAAGEITKKMVAAAPNSFKDASGNPDPEKIANFQSGVAHSLAEKATKPAAHAGAGKGKGGRNFDTTGLSQAHQLAVVNMMKAGEPDGNIQASINTWRKTDGPSQVQP